MKHSSLSYWAYVYLNLRQGKLAQGNNTKDIGKNYVKQDLHFSTIQKGKKLSNIND